MIEEEQSTLLPLRAQPDSEGTWSQGSACGKVCSGCQTKSKMRRCSEPRHAATVRRLRCSIAVTWRQCLRIGWHGLALARVTLPDLYPTATAGVFTEDGGSSGDITARRMGRAWLVVQGGTPRARANLLQNLARTAVEIR